MNVSADQKNEVIADAREAKFVELRKTIKYSIAEGGENSDEDLAGVLDTLEAEHTKRGR